MQTKTSYNPDVLSCLANLSSDEVFTPPKLANEVLDLLPSEIWQDKGARFLDPACKTGIFLREIARRLNEGLKNTISDPQERLNHIYTRQIFGIAITELTSLLTRRSLYCSKNAGGKYSVCDQFLNETGNIHFSVLEHTWSDGYCVFCGANSTVLDRGDTLESYAYPFIHEGIPQEWLNMKFDVIISNPPYQFDTGGSGRQAKPIYQHFINQAKKMNPHFISMIIPSRWFAGGMGLSDFRETMLQDKRIRKMIDYIDARDCFPGVDIAGGICYFLWNRDEKGLCEVVNNFKDKKYTSLRDLNEFPTFIRYSPAVPILNKILGKTDEFMTKIISSTRPFGIPTTVRPSSNGNLYLISSKGRGKIEANLVTSGFDMINKWKVMTSKTSHDHAGQPDKDGTRRVLSRVEVIQPSTVCTESYIILGSFDTKIEAINCLLYVKTKFVRFLISLLSFSQDITRERFMYVPLVDMKEAWNDEKLFDKYELSIEEIKLINSLIRPMV